MKLHTSLLITSVVVLSLLSCNNSDKRRKEHVSKGKFSISLPAGMRPDVSLHPTADFQYSDQNDDRFLLIFKEEVDTVNKYRKGYDLETYVYNAKGFVAQALDTVYRESKIEKQLGNNEYQIYHTFGPYNNKKTTSDVYEVVAVTKTPNNYYQIIQWGLLENWGVDSLIVYENLKSFEVVGVVK